MDQRVVCNYFVSSLIKTRSLHTWLLPVPQHASSMRGLRRDQTEGCGEQGLRGHRLHSEKGTEA